MKRIFITGVTGFVGSNLVKHFSARSDFSVIGYSSDVVKAKKQFDQFNIEIVDQYSASLFNDLKIDCVIHLAGIAHDLSNLYKPEDYYSVNEENSKKVYDEFLRSNASKFIFVSSIKAAVDVSSIAVEENVTPNPVTDYGKSKLNAENYIQSKAITGKSFYILRPCMIHGPGNKGNLNLLYRFVKTGIPFPLGAFTNKRSFLGIENFNFVVQQLAQGEIASGVYHLADEGYLSTTELYNVIAEVLRKHPRVLNIPPSWITNIASVLGKKHLVNKLTEDMMVSNRKIVSAIGARFPVTLRDGLVKTIKSFHE